MVNLTLGRNPVYPPRIRCSRKRDRRSRNWSASARSEERTFWEFEKRLLVLLFGLGRVLTRLMLVHRHLRVDRGQKLSHFRGQN